MSSRYFGSDFFKVIRRVRRFRRGTLSLSILMAAFFWLAGCGMKTYRHPRFPYWISVPSDWKLSDDGWFLSQEGDKLRVSAFPYTGPLDTFIESWRASIQVELVGFIIEDEAWVKIRGRKSWKMVGTLRQPDKNIEETWTVLMIDGGKYKYRLEIITPSEKYRQRKPLIDKIINSFGFKLL